MISKKNHQIDDVILFLKGMRVIRPMKTVALMNDVTS